MAVYEINGARYGLPDDLTGEQLEETLMYLSSQDMEGTQTTPQFGPVRDSIDPHTLTEDRDWMEASRVIYRMNKGEDWKGDDEGLAQYGLEFMGMFNYNLPKMAVDTNRISQASQHEKEAFLYLMDSYDNLEMSWGGVGRFFKGVLTDPTTYVGLGTLGIGTAAAQGGKAATKQGIRQLLRQGLRAGSIGAVEGAMYAGADNAMRQTVRIEAGRQEGFDVGQAGRAVGTGAAVGLVGATVLDAGVNRIRQVFLNNRVVDEAPVTPRTTEGVEPTVPRQDEAPADTPSPTPKEAPSEDLTQAPAEVSSRPNASTSASVDQRLLEGPEAGPTGGLPASIAREPDGLFEYTKLDDLPVSKSMTDIPYKRQTIQENVQKAMRLAQELKNLHHTQIDDIAEQLRTREMTLKEFEEFMLSTKLARDWAAKERAMVTARLHGDVSPEEAVRLKAKEDELGELFSRLESMDEALGSHSGYMLRQRQEGLQFKQLPTDDPEEFARQVFKAEETAQMRQLKQSYNHRIEKAIADGDYGEAARLSTLRNMEVDGHLENQLGKEPGFIRKLNEAVISNVFSATTLAVNFVPSAAKVLYRPILNTVLTNPFEAATRREMTATYSAMASSVNTAWRAALAAFKYEQALLTRESARMLEGELAIKGLKGGAIRFIPRLLNATDEFLSHMTYQGFIAGEVAGEAHEAGLRQGLKGKALDRHVKEQVKIAIERSYTSPADEHAVRAILNKGINLGLTGEKLANYVKREAVKNPVALRHGNNEEGLNYVRDVLYKRAFSGENTASKIAQRYEQMVNDAPVLRLMGQLFFRTPVRVFEEGVRMTPGIQLVAPNFIKDLRGVNGHRAQVRAQGEALMSLAMTGTVLTLYAQGAITGDGAYSHWKQQRARGDSDLPEPYTIQMPDGSTWSYRNFDPLATPVKIIVNGLERYEQLSMRQRQGEFINKEEWDKALAAVTVGTGAIAQAIRDASLMSGLDGALELAENLADPENREGAGLKYLGERLKWLVPNTLHKIAKSNDPEIDDPATFWQTVESRLLSGATLGAHDKTTPKSYDALGNVRTIADVGAMWNIFSTATPEERAKGKSELELEVLQKLDHLSKQTGVIFDTPYVHRMTGKLDLRTQLTSDGDETLYDRWQRYYKEMAPEQLLAPILNAGAPVGTASFNGATVSLVRSTINQLRDAAFYRLMAEEAEVTEQVIQNLIRKSEVQSGFWDQPFR